VRIENNRNLMSYKMSQNNQEKEESNNNSFQHEIIIDRIACPLHVLQMKKAIKKIKRGEILKIISTAYVLPELLAAARQIGSKVSYNQENELFIVK